MDIKDVIHNKRIEHGMTMKDLASAVGVKLSLPVERGMQKLTII